MKKIEKWYNDISCTRYWMIHAVVALVLCLLIHWSAGLLWYASREETELEKIHKWDWSKFDWKGFLAPAIVSIIVRLFT